jgi:5,5'-dehydrodivanillate O-demethylase
MPFEPACLPLRINAYPVQELSAAIWAYLGPEPAPLLPRWDLLVRDDIKKHIRTDVLPCNWLQCVDNTLDPVHFEHLHGVYGNYVMKRMGRPPMLNPARHVKIDFDLYEYGIYKRRLLEGEPEDSPDWTVGHPIIFPHILVVPTNRGQSSLVYRVPVDDTHTLSFVITGEELKPGEASPSGVPVIHDPLEYDKFGRVIATHVGRQDELAFIGQGPVADRTAEHLGTGDSGLRLFRQLLLDNLDRVSRGEDPMGVIRDPARNEPMIEIALGTERAGFRAGVPEEHWGGVGKVAPGRR